MKLTARVMEARWGRNAVSEKVKKALDEGKPDECFEVVHAVYPRPMEEQRYAAGAKKMPWASCWVEKDTKHVIAEGGRRDGVTITRTRGGPAPPFLNLLNRTSDRERS